jgi:Nucleotide modification associated domain 3
MKAMLLRVGIDKGYGALSPVFTNLTYKYIPIYYKDIKEKEENEKRTYRSLALDSFLPSNLWDKKVHLDPEFDSFTYGDPTKPKRKNLMKLAKGDLLVFYIGGKPIDCNQEDGCFIIGYFVVKNVIDWNAIPNSQRKSIKKTFAKNAHIISSKSKNNLVLVKGSSESKMLTHCIPITERNKKSKNPPYLTSQAIQNLLGIRSFIVRAVPIWVSDSKHINNLKQLLGIHN